MKKNLLLPALAALLSFAACKKDSKNENDPFKLGYSNLSTEEHKKNLENSGRDFITKIEGLKDEKALDVLNYLSEIGISVESDGLNRVLSVSSAAKKNEIGELFKVSQSSEVQSLSEHFGIYTWDSAAEDWVKETSNDRLEFNFPSSQSSSGNNAVLTLTYVKSGINTNLDGEKIELPASINAVLKVDSKEELKLVSAYSYESDGTPVKTNAQLTIGSYTFKVSASNTGSNPQAGFSLEKGAEQLLSMSLSAKGSLSTAAAEEDDFENIIHNANVSFEIMDLKLAGAADFKGIAAARDKWEKLPEEKHGKEEAAAWNKYAQLAAINKKDNTLIAKNEFVSVDYQDCYSNGQSEYCYNYYEIEPRLIFKDGSKVSVGDFFETGFDTLISDLEELFTSYE